MNLSARAALSPTTEAYSELQLAYDFFNVELFESQLPRCLLTFQRDKRSYGYFSSNRFRNATNGNTTDEIAMNCAYFATVPLIESLQTLAHEMVHLWQFHFGNPVRRAYHNKEFAEKMKSVGLMPSDTGRPGGKEVGQSMADYPIPNGPFLRACTKLLKTDFRLTWMDSFPITPHHVRTPDELAGDPNASELVELGAFSLPISPAGEVENAVAALPQPNRSNRVKYSCPNCSETNVWGKPGLENRLACVPCALPLEIALA